MNWSFPLFRLFGIEIRMHWFMVLMIGILVLQAIRSGLNIINVDSDVRFVVTGLVLLLAVAIDSVSRRVRTSSGRG